MNKVKLMRVQSPDRSKILISKAQAGQSIIESSIACSVILLLVFCALKLLINLKDLIVLDYLAFRGARVAIVKVNEQGLDQAIEKEIGKSANIMLPNSSNRISWGLKNQNKNQIRNYQGIKRGSPLGLNLLYNGLSTTQNLITERDQNDWY